jgi:2-oxoisovalerate dehydrogenase E1 component
MEKTEIQTDWISLYRHMQLARCIDGAEKDLVARGEAFFQLCGSGHEASATLATFLSEDDYLHCHYRDKALLLARGVPVVDFLHSVLCNAASHSAGRQMSPFLSVPSLHVLPMVVPVGNHALQAVGVAQAIRDLPSRPIVLCGMGDGTTQQGEVFEAIAEAVRSSLPGLFEITNTPSPPAHVARHFSLCPKLQSTSFTAWTSPGWTAPMCLPVHANLARL